MCCVYGFIHRRAVDGARPGYGKARPTSRERDCARDAVYVLEGTFTLELEGRGTVTVKAGQAMVEPPKVKMTGYNRSATETLRVMIFYVSDPGTPFLDLAQQ